MGRTLAMCVGLRLRIRNPNQIMTIALAIGANEYRKLTLCTNVKESAFHRGRYQTVILGSSATRILHSTARRVVGMAALVSIAIVAAN